MNQRTKAVKDFIRHKYAWPGGYPLFAVTSDCAALCHACTKDNAKLVIRETRNPDRWSQWGIAGIVNWEDPDLYCDHCSQRIESAYGEDV